MAEPIDMPFAMMTRVRRSVLYGGPDYSTGRGNFGGNVAAHCKVMGCSTVSCARTAVHRSRCCSGWRLRWAQGTTY